MNILHRLAAASLLAVSAAAIAAEPVVVLENGPIQVTDQDFKASLTRFPENLRELASAQDEVVRRNIDTLFVNRTLAARARAEGLDKDPLVQLRGVQIQEAFLATKYLEQAEAKFKVPPLEARARELYLADPSRYMNPSLARVHHIVVSHMNRTPEMAKARAEEARAKLVAGKPLAEVSQEYNEGPLLSRKTGDLGEVAKADLEPTLGEAAFTQPLKAWSQPIVLRTSTHLVWVEYRKPAQQFKFEDVKAAIIEDEADKLRKAATERLLTSIRADPKNTVYKDRAEALRSNFDLSKADAAQREAIRQIDSQKTY